MSAVEIDLYATGKTITYLNRATMASYVNGCAIYEWPVTPDGEGTPDPFVVVSHPPTSGSASVVSSEMLESYVDPSALPAWRVDGAWSQFLLLPSMVPSCDPPGT